MEPAIITLPANETVYGSRQVGVTIEVRVDGKSHLMAWARLPTPSGHDDFNRADILAFRIQ